jgi:dTDP-4-dehydrorhamnose 3,5-epimerase
MGKVMRVTCGSIFLVAVDIRKGSPTLGQWHGIEVSAENRLQVYAPAGFARGFSILSEYAEVQYKCTSVYNPNGDGGIRWNDPEIAIRWPEDDYIVSQKDQAAPSLSQWLASPQAEFLKY